MISRPAPDRYGNPCVEAPNAGTHASGVVTKNESVVRDIRIRRKLPSAETCGRMGYAAISTPITSPSSHSFDSGMRMVVASRPIGATIEVDRRSFIKTRLSPAAALCSPAAGSPQGLPQGSRVRQRVMASNTLFVLSIDPLAAALNGLLNHCADNRSPLSKLRRMVEEAVSSVNRGLIDAEERERREHL
jgi:hypothetical protein